MEATGVKLQRSGDWWQACWRTTEGRRRYRKLGKRADMTKRRAIQACRELAIEVGVDPVARDGSRAPRLDQWVKDYQRLREVEVQDTTHTLYQQTCDRLVKFFGAEARVDRISRAGAEDWRRDMLAEKLAEQTVRSHTRRAVAIFNRLVKRGVVSQNPFDHLPRTSRPSESKAELDGDMIPKLLDAARDPAWRGLIALVCYAGLRRGEARAMTWDRIDWGQGKMRVPNLKTKHSTGKTDRVVRMEPELEAVLLELHEIATDARIAPTSPHMLHQYMEDTVKRAGLPVYPKPFHAWRGWRSTSWKQTFPEHVVDSWLGHSQAVARAHYNTVPDHYYGESEVEKLRRMLEESERNAAELRQKLEASAESPS